MATNHSNRASDGRRAKHRQAKAGLSVQDELRFLSAQAELNAPKAIQVWRPQRNSITCMDALSYLWQVESDSVDMILCDLPYGITALEDIWDKPLPLPELWKSFERVIKPHKPIVLTASEPFNMQLGCSNLALYRYSWIWEKEVGTNFLNAKKEPLKEHEHILVFCDGYPEVYNPQYIERIDKQRAKYDYKPINTLKGDHPYGTIDFPIRRSFSIELRQPRSILKFNREMGLHPTQKPVALFEYLIKTYTQPGDVVLDPTCGSGTTAVAALRTGRQYLCNDIMPEYVAIAQQRARYWYKDIKLGKTDAYQHKTVADGVQQLSLFAEAG